MTEMTPVALRDICRELKQYNTPELNDKLYLHYKGWKNLDPCLGAYSGCKAIWLEGNGLQKIENLDGLKELRCLFAQQNLIETIEGLESNEQLDTINLSNNQITRIENLASLTKLNTLNLASNKIVEVEACSGLEECPSIAVLDVSNNRIDDPAILALLEDMPNLKVLHLSGNPVVRKIPNYRKTLVSRLKMLTYLDDRPVFDDERRCCEAWAVGGREAEKAERAAIQQEKDERDRANREAFRRMINESRARKGLAPVDDENLDSNIQRNVGEASDSTHTDISEASASDVSMGSDTEGDDSNSMASSPGQGRQKGESTASEGCSTDGESEDESRPDTRRRLEDDDASPAMTVPSQQPAVIPEALAALEADLAAATAMAAATEGVANLEELD